MLFFTIAATISSILYNLQFLKYYFLEKGEIIAIVFDLVVKSFGLSLVFELIYYNNFSLLRYGISVVIYCISVIFLSFTVSKLLKRFCILLEKHNENVRLKKQREAILDVLEHSYSPYYTNNIKVINGDDKEKSQNNVIKFRRNI